MDAKSLQLREQLKVCKLRFITKIYKCLELVNEDPKRALYIGVCWSDDGKMLYTNTLVLAEYLQLKPNSVIKNFILCKFSRSTEDALPDILGIKDHKERKCWVCRYSDVFTRDVHMADIEQNARKINAIQYPAPPPKNSDFLGLCIDESSSNSIYLTIKTISTTLIGPEKSISKYIQLVSACWPDRKTASLPASLIYERLYTISAEKNPPITFEIFLSFICQGYSPLSDPMVHITDFYMICFRFGVPAYVLIMMADLYMHFKDHYYLTQEYLNPPSDGWFMQYSPIPNQWFLKYPKDVVLLTLDLSVQCIHVRSPKNRNYTASTFSRVIDAESLRQGEIIEVNETESSDKSSDGDDQIADMDQEHCSSMEEEDYPTSPRFFRDYEPMIPIEGSQCMLIDSDLSLPDVNLFY